MSYSSLPSIRSSEADTAYHIFSTYVWPVLLTVAVLKWQSIRKFVRSYPYSVVNYSCFLVMFVSLGLAISSGATFGSYEFLYLNAPGSFAMAVMTVVLFAKHRSMRNYFKPDESPLRLVNFGSILRSYFSSY